MNQPWALSCSIYTVILYHEDFDDNLLCNIAYLCCTSACFFILINKTHGWRAANRGAPLDFKKSGWAFDGTSAATQAQVSLRTRFQPAASLTGFVVGSLRSAASQVQRTTFPHSTSGKRWMHKVSAFAACRGWLCSVSMWAFKQLCCCLFCFQLLSFFSSVFNSRKKNGCAPFHTWMNSMVNRFSTLVRKVTPLHLIAEVVCVIFVSICDNTHAWSVGNNESRHTRQTSVPGRWHLMSLKSAFVVLFFFFLILNVSNHLIAFVWLSPKVSCPPARTWTEAAATFACWPLMGGSTALAAGSACCWMTTDACVSRRLGDTQDIPVFPVQSQSCDWQPSFSLLSEWLLYLPLWMEEDEVKKKKKMGAATLLT